LSLKQGDSHGREDIQFNCNLASCNNGDFEQRITERAIGGLGVNCKFFPVNDSSACRGRIA